MSPPSHAMQLLDTNAQDNVSDAKLQDGAKVQETLGPPPMITEFFDLDDRPTLILDLESTPVPTIVYHNGSLGRLRRSGLEVGTKVTQYFGSTYEEGKVMSFLNWACNENSHASIYWDLQWTTRPWRKRWKIVTGAPEQEKRRQSMSGEPSRLSRTSTETFVSTNGPRTNYPAYRPLDVQINEFRSRQEEKPINLVIDEQLVADQDPEEDYINTIGNFNFTDPTHVIANSSFIQFFRHFDWAATPLGAIRSWSPTLRRIVNMLLADPRAAAFYWGSNHIMVYNEAYSIAMSQRHPHMMGKTFEEAFADSPQVLEGFMPALEHSTKTGAAFAADDALFYLQRYGYLEETYFSISMTPTDGEGDDYGFYNAIFETTRQNIADRRMAFLLRTGQRIAASKEPRDWWQELLLSLQEPHLDLPFALLYSAGEEVNETLSASSEHSSGLQNWVLEGASRVPKEFTSKFSDLGKRGVDCSELIPNFHNILKSTSPTLLSCSDGTFPESLAQSIPVVDGGHYCDAAVFLPIRSTGENILGFLLIGVNPHRKFDDDYSLFIELLSRQLTTSLASALLLEEEMFRAKMISEQAQKDKDMLSRKIEIQSHEVTEVESRFRRMADLAPVGMFHIDPQGVLIYANDNYYALTEHPRDVSYPMSWYNVIADIDHSTMDVEWAKLLAGEYVNFELRLKRPFFASEIVGGEQVAGDTWIIAAAYAEKDADGTVVGILGCITDVSRIKWTEDFQNRRRLEAIELKRQQENFIDMTSHEMRNPLSAIIQSADWIATSISSSAFDSHGLVRLTPELIESYSEAASTIMLCASHQTRIIDDILTLSKLDSNLLIITPVERKPHTVAETAVKMFTGEMHDKDIQFSFRIMPDYDELCVEWVMLDPSRLLQVLINLLTNAIKFTQSEGTRKITLSLGASRSFPPPIKGVHYIPTNPQRRDMSQDAGWGNGEIIYLYFAVKDTGRGLDEAECNHLFKRFSQSSPRTHVQYGGSGLGLFISKELTEVQGGRIGVQSTAGLGSTFAFYVRTRRCEAPPTPLPGTPTSSGPQRPEMPLRVIPEKVLSHMQSGHFQRLAPVTSASAPEAELPTLASMATQVPLGEDKPYQKHVLVVEDNLVNQKVLAKQLRTTGYAVHVANHGQEALNFLEKSRFWHDKVDTGAPLDVILMDLEMPVMDGLTAVKKIRALEAEGKVVGHVPTLCLTANARSAQINTARDAGMDSVVTKPFRIPDLVPEIERWCSPADLNVKASKAENNLPLPSGL